MGREDQVVSPSRWMWQGWVIRGTMTWRQPAEPACPGQHLLSVRTQHDMQCGFWFTCELAASLLPTSVLSEVSGVGVLSFLSVSCHAELRGMGCSQVALRSGQLSPAYGCRADAVASLLAKQCSASHGSATWATAMCSPCVPMGGGCSPLPMEPLAQQWLQAGHHTEIRGWHPWGMSPELKPSKPGLAHHHR